MDEFFSSSGRTNVLRIYCKAHMLAMFATNNVNKSFSYPLFMFLVELTVISAGLIWFVSCRMVEKLMLVIVLCLNLPTSLFRLLEEFAN